MSGEEWGPWLVHHGKGCDVIGQVVKIKRRNGSVDGPYIAGTVGPSGSWGNPMYDCWVHEPKGFDIKEYRVKKPKGLTMLEKLIQSLPTPTKPKETENVQALFSRPSCGRFYHHCGSAPL